MNADDIKLIAEAIKQLADKLAYLSYRTLDNGADFRQELRDLKDNMDELLANVNRNKRLSTILNS